VSRSVFRLAFVVAFVVLAVFACSRRQPPPGSGALETTPTGPNASSGPPLADGSNPRVAIYPNGALIVADPKQCRVTVLELEQIRWTREFASCAGLVDPAVAADSVAYVRTARELFAIERDGRERWRAALDADVPRSLGSPTTMADSRPVIVASPRSVVAYQLDGKPAWRFSMPASETIIAPPVGMRTEGIAVVTSHAAYAIGADGELRWRAAVSAAPSAL
jgi:outer membrane protein assembly factor BamB